MTANAGLLGFGAVTWKEEVLLHDGNKIIVERSQSYGGRHEIGQSQPVKEQEISFTVPGTNKAIIFKSEFSEDVGRANFNLLALHIIKSTPYLVVEPNLCLSYNKWGRPNPPYLFFKHDSKTWQRITLSELPVEFKSMNLIINNGREEHIKKAESDLGYVPAESVQKINSSLKQPEYGTILREPLQNYGKSCGEMVSDGKGGWIGIGWFRKQASLESCLKYCEFMKISTQHCPCGTIFNRK